jgi:hypothetical protein
VKKQLIFLLTGFLIIIFSTVVVFASYGYKDGNNFTFNIKTYSSYWSQGRPSITIKINKNLKDTNGKFTTVNYQLIDCEGRTVTKGSTQVTKTIDNLVENTTYILRVTIQVTSEKPSNGFTFNWSGFSFDIRTHKCKVIRSSVIKIN